MHEIIPIKVIYHSDGAKTEKQIHIRFQKSDFPDSASVKRYIKNIVVNNYANFLIARKIEVNIPINSNEIANILKAKAKKVEVVEQVTVDVYW